MSKNSKALDEEALSELKTTVAALVQQSLSNLTEKGTELSKNTKSAIEASVKEKPIKTAAISFLVGATLGYLIRK